MQKCGLALSVLMAMVACGGSGASDGASSDDVRVCLGTTSALGVDVSVYQGTVGWGAVRRSGRSFAIARVSDGLTHPDSRFAANWAGMKSAGLVRGAYQFFRPGQDAVAQADLLLRAVGTLGRGDLAPVIDVEVLDGKSGAAVAQQVGKWVQHVAAATGRTPIIYTAPGFWAGLSGTSGFAREKLWVANWGVSCPSVPAPWKAFELWQSADNARVAGISGLVDGDVFNGSIARLHDLAAGAPDQAGEAVDETQPEDDRPLGQDLGATMGQAGRQGQ